MYTHIHIYIYVYIYIYIYMYIYRFARIQKAAVTDAVERWKGKQQERIEAYDGPSTGMYTSIHIYLCTCVSLKESCDAMMGQSLVCIIYKGTYRYICIKERYDACDESLLGMNTHNRTHTYVYLYIYIYFFGCIHLFMYMCIHFICMYINISICTPLYTSICTQINL
jgi:hypothetical protein